MYPEGEALLLTQIRAATGYAVANVTRGDWRFLNRENVITGAVIRPGQFNIGYGSARVDGTWRALVEVFHKYVDDGTTLTNLETDVKNIINRLILYPHLQDTTNTITQAAVIGGGDVLRLPTQGGPKWLMQELTIEWLEQNPITYSE